MPPRIAAEHRGAIRLSLDVEWLMEEVKIVTPGLCADLLLSLADRQDRGLPVWKEMRQLRVLGGAPADRGDVIGGLIAGYRGTRWVEARVLRGIDLDDVDSWIEETGLPVLHA